MLPLCACVHKALNSILTAVNLPTYSLYIPGLLSLATIRNARYRSLPALSLLLFVAPSIDPTLRYFPTPTARSVRRPTPPPNGLLPRPVDVVYSLVSLLPRLSLLPILSLRFGACRVTLAAELLRFGAYRVAFAVFHPRTRFTSTPILCSFVASPITLTARLR